MTGKEMINILQSYSEEDLELSIGFLKLQKEYGCMCGHCQEEYFKEIYRIFKNKQDGKDVLIVSDNYE